MDNTVLIGVWRIMITMPPELWQSQLAKMRSRWNLTFMTADHHRLRDFVVRELPHFNRPLPPELIAAELQMPLERVIFILDELERNKSFLFRNQAGAVTWAYPVTVDKTPHRVTFSSGERLYAA